MERTKDGEECSIYLRITPLIGSTGALSMPEVDYTCFPSHGNTEGDGSFSSSTCRLSDSGRP